MKIAAFLIFLAVFFHFFFSSKEENVSHYHHFREKYCHNLKNPLVKHYRDLSCESSGGCHRVIINYEETPRRKDLRVDNSRMIPSKEMRLYENATKERYK